jgi:tetratricopeptide (TPR) repeat protein
MRYLFLCAWLCIMLKAYTQTQDSLRDNIGLTLVSMKLDSSVYWGKRLIQAYPSADNYLVLASVYQIKGDTINANRSFQSALDRSDSSRYRVYKIMSQAALDRGDTLQSIRLAKASLDQQLNQASVHYFLGNVYMAHRQRDSAWYHYGQAYLQDSTNETYQQLAFVQYADEGNLFRALDVLAQSVSSGQRTMNKSNGYPVDSRDSAKVMVLATGYIETDQFRKANELLLSLLHEKLLSDTAYFLLGESFQGIGDFGEAAGYYRTAIALAKAPISTYYEKLLRLYERTGESQPAIELMYQGAAAGIVSFENWTQEYKEALPKIQAINDSLQTAAGELRKALLTRLARFYLFAKHSDFSLRVISDLEAMGMLAEDGLLLKAQANFTRGRLDVAEVLAENLLTLQPLSTDYYLLLLSILFERRSYHQFLSIVRRAEAAGVPVHTPEVEAMIEKCRVVLQLPLNKRRVGLN